MNQNPNPISLKLRKTVMLCCAVGSLVLGPLACSENTENGTPPHLSESQLKSIADNYAQIVLATYEDSHSTALVLESAVEQFATSPSPENLEIAKLAWLTAREPYGQSEAFRFYDGPIDDANSGPEGFLNSWPLDESYMDYVEGNPTAGIINDPVLFPNLDGNTLMSLNLYGGETQVAVGYHAVEFLLWGQDLNVNPGEAGQRPYTDYLDDGSTDYPLRREEYLLSATALIPQHLNQVIQAWAEEDPNNFRNSEFSTLPSLEALRRILVGIGTLANGELAGERLGVALVTGSQEDEHSCFSDNTHRDILLNLQGILNVWQGTYTDINGVVIGDAALGLKSLFDQMAPERSALMQDALDQALASAEQIDNVAKSGRPFDEQIQNSTDKDNIQNLINALESFANELVLASQEGLELSLNTTVE